jgi:ABC-2 type transport system ATP-binding protein
MMDGILDFEDLTKNYCPPWSRRRVCALANFSLSLEAGEICGFLGPNGAGKTTAIHLALGFMRPSKGGGRLLGKPFGHAGARAHIGFLPENTALYHRPARNLLQFYGALNGLNGPGLRKRCREVLDRLDLAAVSQRNAAKLSRGMQQRIGLAQALLNNPELLILDEPTSALDPTTRVAVRELLVEANGEGKTIFLSSHLLSEIEMICDRVVVLHKGRLVRVARTAELLLSSDQYEVIARGIPASSFAGAEARDGRTVFTVPASSQRQAIEQVWHLGGEVLSLNPARRTLEEVFLELTNGTSADE